MLWVHPSPVPWLLDSRGGENQATPASRVLPPAVSTFFNVVNQGGAALGQQLCAPPQVQRVAAHVPSSHTSSGGQKRNHSVRMFCQGQSFGDQGCGVRVSRPWPSLQGRGQLLSPTRETTGCGHSGHPDPSLRLVGKWPLLLGTKCGATRLGAEKQE